MKASSCSTCGLHEKGICKWFKKPKTIPVNVLNKGCKYWRSDFAQKIIDKFGSKGLPQGRIDIRNYPEILNLESRSEKIDKTLKNMLMEYFVKKC